MLNVDNAVTTFNAIFNVNGGYAVVVVAVGFGFVVFVFVAFVVALLLCLMPCGT